MRPKPSISPMPPSAKRPFVPFPKSLVPVRLVKRLNRFAIQVTMDDTPAASPLLLHLPNSGRMEELLVEGTRGFAVLSNDGARKTAGTLLLVQYNNRWVSVDSRMPNRLFERCLSDSYFPAFRGYDQWQSEVAWGKGRIDFKLSGANKPDFLLETKSCNLVEGGIALFPDAPTERGTRHLAELTDAIHKGYKAAMVWFVQRDDATRFAPHATADPTFSSAFEKAVLSGVEAYVYRCRVTPEGIEVLDSIPIVRP